MRQASSPRNITVVNSGSWPPKWQSQVMVSQASMTLREWGAVHQVQMEAEAPSLEERVCLLEGMLCQDSTDGACPPWLQDAAAQTAGLLPRVGACHFSPGLWPFLCLPSSCECQIRHSNLAVSKVARSQDFCSSLQGIHLPRLAPMTTFESLCGLTQLQN